MFRYVLSQPSLAIRKTCNRSNSRGMRIIDSPGVVFDEDSYDDGKGSKRRSVLLRNVVKVEDIEEPRAVSE